MSEGVFRMRVGGDSGTAAQFAYLRELAGHPGFELRVIPFDIGAYPYMEVGTWLTDTLDSWTLSAADSLAFVEEQLACLA